MEETDDFGDLYADLDYPPSSIPGLDGPVAERNIESSPKRAESADKAMVDLEPRSSDYSDSDDDFNIVLNEDERPGSFSPKEGAAAAAAGEGEFEDEGVGFAGAMGGNRLSYDLDDGPTVQKSDERGARSKSGNRGPYAGSHLVGPRASRASMSRGGDWNQLAIRCFGGSSSYKLDISEAAERGFGFSLPRRRTIFDINIEVFERKPWRHQGVDMADYFNFGMDEGSWKKYCECLDNYRRQATMPTKYLGHQSNQCGQGEINSLVSENVEKGERGFDMPKGRAIQVEGGFGERIPSTDARRPRHRDSDVVIEIAMDGTEGDVSILSNISEHVEEGCRYASQKVLKRKSYGRTLSPCYEGQICKDITNSDKDHSSKVNGSTSGRTYREAKCKVDYKKDGENPLRSDACKFEVDSRSDDKDRHTSSSYEGKSHPQECKDGYPVGKESRRIHKASLRSNTRFEDSTVSDHYYSDDSRNDIRTDQEGGRVIPHEHNLSFEVHKTKLEHTAQSHVGKAKELACNLISRKHRSDVYLRDTSSKKRKRKSTYGSDDRDNLPSYKETRMSLTYKSRRYGEQHGTEKSYTKDSRKSDLLTHYGRNLDDEYCSEEMECYFSERCHDDQGIRSFSHKGSGQSIIKQRSYFLENDSCLRMAEEERREQNRRGTKYDDSRSDCRYRERRVNSVHGGYLPSYDTEEEIFDLKSGRHFYSSNRVTQSPVRSRYDRSCFHLNRSSRFDDVNVIESGHLDHRLLFSGTVEDPCPADGRSGNDAGSPCDDLRLSWKSSRRDMDHRGHHDGREFQSLKTRCGYGPCIKSEYHSSYEDGQESDVGSYNFEEKHMYHENIISSIQMNRQNWRLKPRHYTDNGVRLKHHWEQDCLSSPERSSLCEWSSRNENTHVNQPSICGHTFSSAHLLKNARKKETVEGYFDARDRANFVSDKNRHELAAVGYREAAHVHMNGWKGKLVRRCGKAAGEKIDTSYKMDKLKDSRHPQMTCKQEEVQMNISVDEESRNRQTNLKAKNPKEAKLSSCNELSQAVLSEILRPQAVGDEEIEEGELIEETDKQEVVVDKKDQLYEKKVIKKTHADNSLSNEKTVGMYGNKHILETLAKMEKRKERFKAPIAPKQGPEKSVNSHADVLVATDEVKLQRPARKRSWGGNY